MKNKYSIFSLIKNAFSYHENWQRAWRDPEPKKEYEAVIIGGGGHGLATAYYLAKKHNMKNIAVLEKGWIWRRKYWKKYNYNSFKLFVGCKRRLIRPCFKNLGRIITRIKLQCNV